MNSIRASPLLLQLVLPHALWCALESHPLLSRDFHFHSIARVPRVPLTEEDPRNHRAGTQSIQLSVALRPSLHFVRTAIRSLQENPGSIHAVSFLVRIQARGLSIPLAWKRVYPGMFRPITRSSRYHASCVRAMSIPLTITAIEIILEAAML